jgi:hypothetical protein
MAVGSVVGEIVGAVDGKVGEVGEAFLAEVDI